jgi:hypothetical protein
MKKLMMIAVMAVACLTANAQKMRHDAGSITIQPMIGFSAGYWRGERNTNGVSTTSTSNEARVGLAIGAEAEYYTSTNWLSISAGLLYQQQGWKFKEDSKSTNIDYINIPVLANFYVGKGFALKIGLQPGFKVNASYDGHTLNDVKSFNLAIPLGLSYEFKNGITLDLRGAASLTRVDDYNDDTKWYSDAGVLTIGYKFELK